MCEVIRMRFELSSLEHQRYTEFQTKHKDCAIPSVEKLDSVQLIVIPTGIGNLVTCECIECGEKEDITDFEELF